MHFQEEQRRLGTTYIIDGNRAIQHVIALQEGYGSIRKMCEIRDQDLTRLMSDAAWYVKI